MFWWKHHKFLKEVGFIFEAYFKNLCQSQNIDLSKVELDINLLKIESDIIIH